MYSSSRVSATAPTGRSKVKDDMMLILLWYGMLRSVCFEGDTGTLDHWDTRTLGQRETGTLKQWDNETLGHFDTGTPGHRITGTLGHWNSGTMGRLR